MVWNEILIRIVRVGSGHEFPVFPKCYGATCVAVAAAGALSLAVAASLMKKVYESVSVLISFGRSALTMKRTGMTFVSPACNACSVKQKHSVLLK